MLGRYAPLVKVSTPFTVPVGPPKVGAGLLAAPQKLGVSGENMVS